jgi:hypothetical protein
VNRLLFFLLVVWSSAAGLDPTGAADLGQGSATWSGVVQRFDLVPQQSAHYWVGLKNQTNRSRALCVVLIRYEVEGREEIRAAEGSPNQLSPHYCEASARHLVLPGETHFVLVGVDIAASKPSAGLVFDIEAFELCADDTPCKDVPIAVHGRLPTTGTGKTGP